MTYDLKLYDHTKKPHGVMPPTTGGTRDGYGSNTVTVHRPKQYIGSDSEGTFEVTAMQYTKDSRIVVRNWLRGHKRPAFFEYGRWIVMHGKNVITYADWEFREMFVPAAMCDSFDV